MWDTLRFTLGSKQISEYKQWYPNILEESDGGMSRCEVFTGYQDILKGAVRVGDYK